MSLSFSQLKYLFATIGFTLSMGTIFMKTYRVNLVIKNALKGIRMVSVIGQLVLNNTVI